MLAFGAARIANGTSPRVRQGRGRRYQSQTEMSWAIFSFAVAAAFVIGAGSMLARAADSIAERTGIGRVWIGSVLLAAATSLPELTTDVSAVRINRPNLAAGDLFGSSLANMLILALIDLTAPRKRVLGQVAFENSLAAALAIALNSLVAVFILARPQFRLARVSPESLILLLTYLLGTRAVYRNGTIAAVAAAEPQPEAGAKRRRALRRAAAEFGIGALVILIAAPYLASSAGRIADLSGLGTTFVGTCLLGLSTSLPELVTSLAAVRMGSFDLAIGNLFGSNSFNMLVFVAMEFASPAPIFARLSPVNALSACLATALMSLGLASIVYRAERRFAIVEPGSALMVVGYAASLWAVYMHVGAVH
jgi:cation:H+ antiporter